MYVGLMRGSDAAEQQQLERWRKRDQLCKELHYTLTQAAWFLLGMSHVHPGGGNTTGAFFQMDHAVELRNEIEALDQGAPSS
jgi:hypothetical protein